MTGGGSVRYTRHGDLAIEVPGGAGRRLTLAGDDLRPVGTPTSSLFDFDGFHHIPRLDPTSWAVELA